MKYWIIALLINCSLIVQSQDHHKIEVDHILTNIKDNGPGVIISVIKNGKVLYSKSKGLTIIESQNHINPSSNFRLSSTSKQFTATCIMHLYQDKKLSLSDPLTKYFPEFSIQLGQVKIQELLNHTSGIRDYMSLLMIKGSDKMDEFNNYIGDDNELYKLVSNQKELAFPAGGEHSYSNTNYWILGQIVQRVSGLSLGSYAQKHIFTPLKMNSTHYVEDYQNEVPNAALGYMSACPDCPIQPYKYLSTAVGDGGVRSTIDDLILWENEFYKHKILSKENWRLMTQKGVLNNGDEISYACGLIIEEYKGHRVIKHSGQNPGFSSQILKFPDEELSIIVLANQNWHDTRNIANLTADVFLEIKDHTTSIDNSRVPKAVSLSKEVLDRFCGDYIYPETGERRTIKNTPNGLIYLRSNGPTSNLIPLSSTTLTYEDRPNVIMKFNFESQKKTNILWSDGTRILEGFLYEPFKLDPNELKNYTETYFNDELNVHLHISLVSEQLHLEMTGQSLPLEPLNSQEFSAMGILKLKFEKNKNDRIIGFRLDAPRAGNIKFIVKSKQ